MLKSVLTTSAIILTASVAHTTPVSYSDPFTSYLAFGDSLTDDGKLGILSPPSLGGRFSNGITYAERIAFDFAIEGKFQENFALGGATAGDVNTTVYPPGFDPSPFATFADQVATLGSIVGTADLGDNPLVSVLCGANDLFQNLSTSATIGFDAANAVKSGIEAIAALDDSLDTFLVLNLPDIALTPGFAGGPQESEAALQSAEFNEQLDANVDMLRDAGLNIIEFDLDAFFDEILADPGAFGILNTDTPCIPSFTGLDLANNCSFELGSGFDLALADDFLFVDPVHPNRVAHQALAVELRAALAPVPLPAGLPLLAAGIGVFAFLRRRRAA